jgi:predicted metal-dependent phosphoesterase TrpH
MSSIQSRGGKMAFELFPLVVPVDQTAVLSIAHLTPGGNYVVRIRARRRDADVSEQELVADDSGRLWVRDTYTVPGEHTIDLFAAPGSDRLARIAFYVAAPELHTRRPLRCDFHIHTIYSDGRNSPAEMLIRGRELGLDAAVITDHNAYAGSIEGIEERERLRLNLITMPGEEVSGPNWHILSINAHTSVYDLRIGDFGLDSDEKRDHWKATTAWEYDALHWAVMATQSHGGRAYLAHPYWAVERGFHLPETMYDQILAEGILDGLELLGDVRYENNVRSLARYLDYRAAGHDIPILGNSDTHWVDHTYGTYWTLVLAENPTPQGVLDAIADGWSVACTTVKPVDIHRRKEVLQAFGPFELVDYAYFLEQQFFPLHDMLCAQEAALAYRAWRGECLPTLSMEEQRASMDALYERCWHGDGRETSL